MADSEYPRDLRGYGQKPPASLMCFLDYVAGHDKVWVPTRLEIARHWHANFAHLADGAPSTGSS